MNKPRVGDCLLDDVPQIQRIAAGQLPQAVGRIGVHRADQRRRQQLGRSVGRQRRQIHPVELPEPPKLLHANGNRFVVTLGEEHLGHASLHDLVQHEHRQVVQQVRVVDTDHDRCGRRRRRQRFDHLAHQMQAVAAGQPRP
jgi:hypothetical protein